MERRKIIKEGKSKNNFPAKCINAEYPIRSVLHSDLHSIVNSLLQSTIINTVFVDVILLMNIV